MVALKAARMFDGKSDRLLTPGIVVVDGSRIVDAGPGARIPSGARVLDLGDATLSPGFMDAHVHLNNEPGGNTAVDRLRGFQETIPEAAFRAAGLAKRTLLAGFTTVRILGSSDFIDIGLRNAIARGEIPGPRILTAVRSIGTPGGHCDPTNSFRPGVLGPEMESPVVGTGPDAMRNAVRWNVKYGADVIKTCATGGVLSLNNDVDSPQLTQEEANALIDQAHTMGKKVAAHAHGAEGAKRAIRAGVDSIEHGSFLDDEALRMMKEKGTYYVPTLLAPFSLKEDLNRLDPRQAAKARKAIDAIDATFRKAVQMGIKIAFGTDAGVFRHGRNAEEFALLVERGMTPIAALKAATSVDAELLGIAAQVGTLEAGKVADVIAMPGDPTADIRVTEKVFFVMKEGVIYKTR